MVKINKVFSYLFVVTIDLPYILKYILEYIYTVITNYI